MADLQGVFNCVSCNISQNVAHMGDRGNQDSDSSFQTQTEHCDQKTYVATSHNVCFDR